MPVYSTSRPPRRPMAAWGAAPVIGYTPPPLPASPPRRSVSFLHERDPLLSPRCERGKSRLSPDLSCHRRLPPVRVAMAPAVRKLRDQSRNLIDLARGKSIEIARPRGIHAERANRAARVLSAAHECRHQRLHSDPTISSTAPSPSSSDALPCDTTIPRTPSSNLPEICRAKLRLDNHSTRPRSTIRQSRVKCVCKIRKTRRKLAKQRVQRVLDLEADDSSDEDIYIQEIGVDDKVLTPIKKSKSYHTEHHISVSVRGEEVSAEPGEICAAKEGHIISQLRILRAVALGHKAC